MTPEEQAKFDAIKNALDFARGAIADAIGCPDGLDGSTGMSVIEMINDALGDGKEWHKTVRLLPEV